jgi:hypothetical protein
MSEPSSPPKAQPAPSPSAHPDLDPAVVDHADGLKPDFPGEESTDRRLAEIEMAGEEVALGWKPAPHVPLSPEVRYLHISRTIHQLITDRNRSVGIFLGVASLLFAASTALLNAKPDVVPIIPLKSIQYWCLPTTFGTLAIIGVFMCLILVRTRIGLIYEVSKMNALLGLPSQRVRKVNPLSIFFLMYVMVDMLGAASCGLTAGMLLPRPPAPWEPGASPVSAQTGSFFVPITVGLIVAVLYMGAFLAIYYGLILSATTDSKLEKARS